MIRWSYLVPRLIVVAVLVAGGWFGCDPLVRWSLESAGHAVLGAPVNVHGLKSSLVGTAVEFDRVQLANPKRPGRNLIEWSSAQMRLETRPLLLGHYIVDEASIRGLQWGTAREASLPAAEDDSALDGLRDQLRDRVRELGALWTADPQALLEQELARLNLETPPLARSLGEKWQQTLPDFRM